MVRRALSAAQLARLTRPRGDVELVEAADQTRLIITDAAHAERRAVESLSARLERAICRINPRDRLSACMG